LLKPSTSKRQVKCDSVQKRQSYRLFNMNAHQIFSMKNCQPKNAI